MRPLGYYKGREQTYAKHLFLDTYLERVARNILSFSDEFIYVDGFSGPWQSGDDEFNEVGKSNAGFMKKGGQVMEVPAQWIGDRLRFVVVVHTCEIPPALISPELDEACTEHHAERYPAEQQHGNGRSRHIARS